MPDAAEPPRRLKAVEDYVAQAKGELTLKIGDVIFVPNFDQQKGQMLHGVSAGKVGRFPRHVLEDTTVVHQDGNVTPVRAVHDYTAATEEELSFPLGAKMFVVHRVDDKWWRGVYNNTDGLIPATHIQADKTRPVEKSAAGAGGKPGAAGDGGGKGGGGKTAPKGPPVWDWGKLPKERAERELQGEPPGTFLVRASETTANAFSISVVTGKTVRHIRLLSTNEGFAVNKADPPVPTIPKLIQKMMGKSLQVRPAGSSGASAEAKLLVKPLPRLPSGPPPCCWKAKPVATAPPAGRGSENLKDAASKLPPAPAGPPKKHKPGDDDPFASSNTAATDDPFAPSSAAVAPEPSANSAVPAVPLSEAEAKVYHGLWERVVDPGESLVQAGPAASFLQLSGIDNPTLGYIWNCADTEKRGMLSEAEFYIALKLVALKQAGQAPELPNLGEASGYPQLTGQTDAVEASIALAAAPVVTTPTASSATATTAGPPWVVQDVEFETYRGFFSGVDKDADGLVNGGEVMGVFLSSKLSKPVLGQIWNLVDVSTEHKGQLDVQQFALAMWIIAEQVKGVPVPATLTPAMIPPSLRSTAGNSGADAAAPIAAAVQSGGEPEFLSVKERAVYNQLWVLAVPAGQEHMGPGEAVTFLQASGLGNDVLGAIWDAADQEPKGQLVKNEFYVALKLIAVKQAGLDVSVANLGTDSPLPALGPHTATAVAAGFAIAADQLPTYEGLWQTASQGQDTVGPAVVGLFQASGLDNKVLGEIWEIADSPPNKGELRKDEFFVALKLIAYKQGGGGPLSESALLQPTAPPKVGGETTAQLADRLWARLGLDLTAMASGGDLRPLLMESGLEVGKLGEVWQLADSQSRGSLNFSEFQTLCGLIGQAQKGEPLDAGRVVLTDTAAKFP